MPFSQMGGYGYQAAPLSYGTYGLPGGYGNRIGRPYFYQGVGVGGAGAGAAGVVVVPMVVGPAQAGYGGYGYGGTSGFGAAQQGVMQGAHGAALYSNHLGPGYYRNSEFGHYRMPYYNYRAPWYNPGPATYQRDTNLPW